MPTEVEIPEVGIVEFPDSMGEEEIADTIRTKILNPTLRSAPLQAPGESQLLAATAPYLPTQAFPVQQDKVESAAQFRAQQEQQARDMAAAAQAGTVTPAQIGVATPSLPKVTAEEIATLLPKGTPAIIPKVAAGLQQGVVSVPEGFLNEWGAAAALAGPIGKVPQVSKAIGSAFVAEMAGSLPKQAQEMVSAFRAGDVEGGTRALASLSATGLIVGSVGAKLAGEELAARRAREMLPYDRAAIENLRLPRTAEALNKTTEAQNAIQERVLPEPTLGPIVKGETFQPNEFSSRTQTKLGVDNQTTEYIKGAISTGTEKASVSWLESISRNDPKAEANAAAELSREQMASEAKVPEGLLAGPDTGGSEVRTPGDYGAVAKSEAPSIGARSSQERRYVGQPGRELGGDEPLSSLQASFLSSNTYGSEASGRAVGKALQLLQNLWENKERTRSAGDLLRMLQEELPNVPKENADLIRKGIYASIRVRIPKTLSLEAPPEVGAKVGEQVRSREEPTLPQKPGEQLSEQVTPKEPLGDVNKPAQAAPEQAPQPAAPTAAAVSSAKPSGVTAPEVPPAISETTTPVEVKQTAQPPIIGMGGATPSEFQPALRTATGIKNAAVDAARAERGLGPIMAPARLAQQTVWERVMAKIDQDPAWQDNLIAELKNKSRNLSQDEVLALDHRYVDLQNEYAKATREGEQAYKDGRLADVEIAKARVAEWQVKLAELEEIARTTGTEWGRAGAMRQRLLREDYTLEAMERKARAAKGFKPLTESERAEFVRKDAELRRIEAELKDKDQALAQAQMARAMAEMEAATAKQQATIPPQIQRIITRVGEVIDSRANAARERLKGKLFTLSPDVLKDLAEIGVSNIYHAGLDFAKWSTRMVEELGDRVKPHLETVWERSKKLLDEITDQVAGKSPRKDRKQASQEIKKPKTTEEVLAETITKVREGVTKEDADINFLARKLARAFYKDGIRDREALIDAVHSVLEGVLPDWSRRQSMDAISGYGTVKPLTKDEVSVALRDLKGQMQQLAKLEDMASGKAPLKTGIERRIPSEVEREMIKQVNEAKKRGGYVTTDPNTQLKSALDTVKTRTRNQIAELERRLREKDFAKKTKTEIQLDKEALDLQYRRKKIQDEVNEKMFEFALANQTIGQKLWNRAVELGNMIRAFQTSAEFSAVLRQGKFIVLTHPIRAAKSLKPMFEAFASEKGAFKVQQDIENRPNYPVYQKAKLFLSERGGPALSRMEEEYRSRLARNLPVVGRIIKGSERAYTTFLNKLRADSFDSMAAKLSRRNVLTLDEAKVLANFINVWTGRGTIAMAEHAGGALNATFFAPRFVASRFQTLLGQPIWYGAVSGKVPLRNTARVRRMIAWEYGKLLGAYATIYSLVQASGIGEVGTESTSSDFGKIVIGNTRIDILAGLSQNTVLLSRIKEGKTTSVEGKESIIRGKVKYGEKNTADIIARFLRTKLAPVPALVVDLASGTDVTGNEITPSSLAKRTLVPITYQDILTVMEDQGVPRGIALQVLGIFGESVDTYTK